MVLNISEQEFQQMKIVVMDGDKDEALVLIKVFIKRLEHQKQQGMKSHLDR